VDAAMRPGRCSLTAHHQGGEAVEEEFWEPDPQLKHNKSLFFQTIFTVGFELMVKPPTETDANPN
jgi:hypothetical protein